MLCKRNSFIVLSACLLFAQACRHRTVDELNLEHQISPQPPRVGRVAIALKVKDASGKPVTGARMRLEADMSHAGMTPVFAEAQETSDGNYRASLELSMAGDWVVVVRAVLPDGRQLERQFEINGVAPE